MVEKSPDPKLRLNLHDSLAIKPGEKEPGGWLSSPASFSLFTAVEKALIRVARLRGQMVARIDNVRVTKLEGDPRVWLYPTDERDPDRIPVRRHLSSAHINLSAAFKSWRLSLPPGQRRRYDLLLDEQSPVGPALCFSIDKPLEIKGIGKGKGPK